MIKQTGKISLDEQAIFEAAEIGIISYNQANELLDWSKTQKEGDDSNVEKAKGFNLVSICYYIGAMLMISSCAWFLGDKWDELGPFGILITSFIYALLTLATGLWLRLKGYIVGGGLLVTVAVCLLPLITYSFLRTQGWWHNPEDLTYNDYYIYISASWLILEIVTIIGSIIALYFTRFGFLTAPLAFSSLFLSMDLAPYIFQELPISWTQRCFVTIVIGFLTIFAGYILEIFLTKPVDSKSEDFAFWCYLFGLFALSSGLNAIDVESESGRLIIAAIHVGLIVVSLFIKRVVFLVFGVIGLHIYLGHLAFRVFQDSVLFPFVISAIGLSMILSTVYFQHKFKKEYK